MRKMKRGKPAIFRDILAGLLPWPFYFIGMLAGHEAAGMLSAVVALLFFRCATRTWHEMKLYEHALVISFGLICLLGYQAGWDWLLRWKAAAVPVLLFVGSLVSVVGERPFSMKYAKQFARPEWWGNPHFLRVNMIISSVWCLVFVFGTLLTLWMVAFGWPGRVALAMISFFMMAVAFCFTRRFPRWYRFHVYLREVKAGRESYMKAPEL